jgi:hypothetical protein
MRELSDIFGHEPPRDTDTGSEYAESLAAVSRTPSQSTSAIVGSSMRTSELVTSPRRIPGEASLQSTRAHRNLEEMDDASNQRGSTEFPRSVPYYRPREMDSSRTAQFEYPRDDVRSAEIPRMQDDEQDSLLSRNTSRQASESSEMTIVSSPVHFIYRVILSRVPYKQKKWQPAGRFQEKSLQKLLQELPVEGNVSSLTFKLFGPDIEVEEMINKGDELEFKAMKHNFKRQMDSAIRARDKRCQDPLLLEIEIEPVIDNQAQHNDEEKEESLPNYW